MTKLDRCWKNCLAMWKWVSENWKPGCDIYDMKSQWLQEHRFTRRIESDCFFCQYDTDHASPNSDQCVKCPGKLVRPRMREVWCQYKNSDWRSNAKAFYRKIVQLNASRTKQ